MTQRLAKYAGSAVTYFCKSVMLICWHNRGLFINTRNSGKLNNPLTYYIMMLATALMKTLKSRPKFEEVERQHPYSALAVRAQVMAAVVYEGNDYTRRRRT